MQLLGKGVAEVKTRLQLKDKGSHITSVSCLQRADVYMMPLLRGEGELVKI